MMVPADIDKGSTRRDKEVHPNSEIQVCGGAWSLKAITRLVLELLAFLVVKQASINLAQCDGQRLFAWLWGNQRAYELEDTFILLLVVAIDLACALSGKDDQSVLRGNLVQKLIDRGIGNADRIIKYWFRLCGFSVRRGGHVSHMHLYID